MLFPPSPSLLSNWLTSSSSPQYSCSPSSTTYM
ncbi:hypothetical protein E2C01_099961 [Portunus trituberculatus]|uniref:Uncharacterized protein n=1 Tax=Portunus trituberculatus TaxID=210409 RepID=A0A5B7K1Q6_PORTR|nr:hypothetical protein [Portunus trituberculatus]